VRRKRWNIRFAFAALLLLGCGSGSQQNTNPAVAAGPAQYIWTSSPSADASQPRYFRKSFTLTSVPAAAMLYFFGPYNADISLNSVKVDSFAFGGPVLSHDRPLRIIDITSHLVAGANDFEITASASEVFSLEIVPAAEGINVPPLVVSDGSWQGSNDAVTWSAALLAGPLEGDVSRFKDNFDLNLYRWPGYSGINAVLNHAVLSSLASVQSDPQTITVDFGKEISGRIKLVSLSSQPIRVHMNFGESAEEAVPAVSFLGTRDLLIPGGGAGYGPVTAFRYVQVAVDAPNTTAMLQISADEVFRNVSLTATYQGSDPQLQAIWQASVYTAQLGMQTEFWDAPKRDRNPFAGDLFISGRTARAAFGHVTDQMVKDTLTDLLNRVCGNQGIPITGQDINCIPSYNGWWILDLADLYQYKSDLPYLQSQRANLLSVLNRMESQVNNGVYVQDPNIIAFADWAPGMYEFPHTSAPDAEAVTAMVYYTAFNAASQLFTAMGDAASSSHYAQIAGQMKPAIRSQYFSAGTFGSKLQTNAMAIFSGVADSGDYSTIYTQVLANASSQQITPYFAYFVLEALKTTGHSSDAITYLKQIWGGMLNADATSFWEFDTPVCAAQTNYHTCLQNAWNLISNSGPRLEVSLAHGWSSGPGTYLMEP